MRNNTRYRINTSLPQPRGPQLCREREVRGPLRVTTFPVRNSAFPQRDFSQKHLQKIRRHHSTIHPQIIETALAFLP
jgi:hypothetical protein